MVLWRFLSYVLVRCFTFDHRSCSIVRYMVAKRMRRTRGATSDSATTVLPKLLVGTVASSTCSSTVVVIGHSGALVASAVPCAVAVY